MQYTTPIVTIDDTGMDTEQFGRRLTAAARQRMGEDYTEKGFFRMCQAEDVENAPSYSTVRNALAGERVPKMDNAIVMARTLDVSLDWLAGFTDEKHSHKKSATSSSEPATQEEDVIDMGPSGSLQAARALGLVEEGDVPLPSTVLPGWELLSDDGPRVQIDLVVRGQSDRSKIKATFAATGRG